jgi:hypothetical protein
VRVTLEPRTNADAEAENELTVGGAGTTEKATVCIMSCPFNVIVPETGEAVYPVTEPTVYETVPFGSENTIWGLVEDRVVP